MALLLGRAGTITGPRTAPRVAQHRVVFAPVTSRPQRGALQVVAAEEQKKKRTDPAVKRAELAVERRMANRSRKSACATYIKKVIKTAEALTKNPPSASAPEVDALEKLVSETYKQIDTAVSKGVYHINTASRKKARVASYKRQVMIATGMYTPKPEEPGFSFYTRMTAAKAAKAAAAQ